jgi:hypothetical protein
MNVKEMNVKECERQYRRGIRCYKRYGDKLLAWHSEKIPDFHIFTSSLYHSFMAGYHHAQGLNY